ncbi:MULTISPECIES: SsgA family sporulation/cell division regulator [Streptomyces]|uniref:Sporulation protein SsgA n=1 Tax=Streptomyces qaidamensis TaxID=1783515 RepID=A0A143CCA4_9ACTN|nr:SsgA family sporulation/cell division regulator [Streptomyces qaidamensis]AMW15077.1 sporulation protein SsgA [Streptomyces qaidamensis]
MANSAPTPRTVWCTLHLRLVVSSDSTLPVPVELRYAPTDPYAVHTTFHTGAEETTEWVFARELLTEGLRRPTGTGDVHIWPSHSHGHPVVCIALSSPEGEAALLEAPAGALRSFLRRTYAEVPPDTEHHHIDTDSLANFLDTVWRSND